MITEILTDQIKAWETFGHPALMERFVIRNGIEMQGSPYEGKPGVKKECFKNAAEMALYEGLDYYEGYAMRPSISIPVAHAWCMDDGKVVDSTWNDPADCSYLGVHITEDDLREQLIQNKVYGVLDTGMINYKFMFKLDPELKGIVEKIIGRELT